MTNPLVTIMLPTRRRPEQLYRTLKSIYDTVADLSRVDVGIRYDMDDNYTFNYMKQCLVSNLPQNAWIKDFWTRIYWMPGDRMKGYASLNLMYTELAEMSKAKYILMGNDDWWLLTQGWDTALAELDKTIPEDVEPIIQFNTHAYGCYEGGPFPMVRNQVWKKVQVGHGVTLAAIPDPADIYLDIIVRKLLNGKTYYLANHFWEHIRATNEELEAHRKL